MTAADVDAAPELELNMERALSAVEESSPLVNAVTNDVTVNDVAQVILHWGGLPVMSDDKREVEKMVAGAQACLLNMGTVSEAGERTIFSAGRAANDHGAPVVLDPVGVGATETRNRCAERLATELDVALINGNHGEVAALAGGDAEVRGVESVGDYADIAATATACAREFDTVVVASGVPDVVATPEAAYEVDVGDPMLSEVVGTGCMLGATTATFAGAAALTNLEAALLGTAGFGLAGEAAAEGAFGEVHGPASFMTAFRDAVAGLAAGQAAVDPVADRVQRVISTE
jgi:hydroxyethylthiazole kinase